MGTKIDTTNESEPNLPLGPGTNNFRTPPSYFDELPGRIGNRIHSSKKETAFFLRPSFALGSLAILCGVAAFFIFINKDIPALEVALSETEIEHVIENPELYDLDEDIITERYLSSNFEPDTDDLGAEEEEIRNFLEESSDATNIINEY